jgi:hypothetical protein
MTIAGLTTQTLIFPILFYSVLSASAFVNVYVFGYFPKISFSFSITYCGLSFNISATISSGSLPPSFS